MITFHTLTHTHAHTQTHTHTDTHALTHLQCLCTPATVWMIEHSPSFRQKARSLSSRQGWKTSERRLGDVGATGVRKGGGEGGRDRGGRREGERREGGGRGGGGREGGRKRVKSTCKHH